MFYEGKIEPARARAYLQISVFGYNGFVYHFDIAFAMMGTALDRMARSEPEHGVSPEACDPGESSRSGEAERAVQ